MQKTSLINELESLVNQIDPHLLPYKKGNSIRIGNYVIRRSSHGHLIYNIETNKQEIQTFTMAGAFAYVNAKRKKLKVERVLEIDDLISKHYLDCLFYKNTYKNTQNAVKKEVSLVRYEISKDKTERLKEKLDQYIF